MKTKQNIAPRVRGKAIQEGHAWLWEILITFEPDRQISLDEYEIVNPITLTSPKETPYLSRELAIQAMKAEVPKLMKIMGEATGDKVEELIDMRTGQRKSVEEYANGG